MAGVKQRANGELEAEVLRALRNENEPLGARDVQDRVGEPKPAYTTVLTALDRLEAKGEVIRLATSPRKVRWTASRTAVEESAESLLATLGAAADRRAVLMSFAGNMDAADADVLRALLEPPRS